MILNYIKIVQKSTSKVDIDIYCARALPRTGTPDTVTCKSVWCCLRTKLQFHNDIVYM